MKFFILILILFSFNMEAQVQWRIPVSGDYLLEEKNDTLLKAEAIININGSYAYSLSFIDSGGTIFNTFQDTTIANSGLGTKPFKVLINSTGFLAGIKEYYDSTHYITKFYQLNSSGALIWSLQLDSMITGYDFAIENDTLFILFADSALKVIKIDQSGNYLATPYIGTTPFNLNQWHTPRIKVKNSRIYLDAESFLKCFDELGQLLWSFGSDMDIITFEINSANQCFILSYEITGPIGMKVEVVKASKINGNGTQSNLNYSVFPAYGYPTDDFGHSIALFQDSVYFGAARGDLFSCDTLQFAINYPHLFTTLQHTKFQLNNVNNNFYIAKTKYVGGSSIAQIDRYLNGSLVYQYSDTATSITSFNSFVFPHSWGFYFGTNGYIGKFTLATSNLIDVSNETFMLFPNPATDQLTIESKYKGPVLIYDFLGQLVGTYEKGVEDLTIDVRLLTKGIYMLRTRSGAGYKFVVY